MKNDDMKDAKPITEGIAQTDFKPVPKILSERYKDIQLTDLEIETALYHAREKKYYALKNKAYWDNVANPVYQTFKSVDEYFEYIITMGKAMVPPTATKPNGFVIDEENEEVLRLLCMYFMGDKSFEQGGYSLSKGLFLYGGWGTTKTTTMRLFAQNPTNSFGIVSCNKVSALFISKENGGYPAIEKYMQPAQNGANRFGNTTAGYCFDDLGTESTKKHFGNESNVMQEILQERYRLCAGNATHITSNLTSAQIEEHYGGRIRSRLRDMVNLIEFKGNTDRRK